MSRDPGIGAKWYHQFRDEVYRDGCVIFKDFKIKAPKFYDSLFELDFPFKMAMLKSAREDIARLKNLTASQLAVKEEVVLSSVNQYKRGYEDGA